MRVARPSDGYAKACTSSVVALTYTCARVTYTSLRPTLVAYSIATLSVGYATKFASVTSAVSAPISCVPAVQDNEIVTISTA